ncbi:DUF4245 domain-containing protein [Mycobacterium hackensackense]|jgi:hypothetical protein|uniref:DUF4245 domain-containing protein n=1 Tax=Mycobacterium hackensackense TaxID=228909 RepID=UPI002265B6C4|nr:DUF4245 domain-containing protein [Mycobacterium hackensackense]MCV7255584.1 DUF4245 domain-containing protein [Mycobacterium hackensackense]
MSAPQEPEADTPIVVPVPAPAKNRLLQDGRDMFWSMAPLVLACVVLAGVLGMCSFQPSGPGAGPAPNYDAPAALAADAAALKIPIRLPALPPGWTANSGGRGGIDGGRVDPATGQKARAVSSRVGYLTPAGMYLSLTQSNADEDALISSLDTDLVPTGTQDVDGVKWVVYEAGEGEPAWTTRLPGVTRAGRETGATQLAITGSADNDEFRVLAKAVQSAAPLPI